jgi:uncharacterized protein YegP (UPF0339 family)
MWKFEIYKDMEDEFKFNLKDESGRCIFTSKGYKSKLSCTNGIETFKNRSLDDSSYERLESETGNPYFIIKTNHGRLIGTSEMFISFIALQDGIADVMTNSFTAIIENNL